MQPIQIGSKVDIFQNLAKKQFQITKERIKIEIISNFGKNYLK